MFASEATRSSVANRVTYSAYSRFATSKPSEQKTAATSAVRHTMRRLGRNLKMMKNSATPSAKERSEEHTSELQSQSNLVCRLLLEKKKKNINMHIRHSTKSLSLQHSSVFKQRAHISYFSNQHWRDCVRRGSTLSPSNADRPTVTAH